MKKQRIWPLLGLPCVLVVLAACGGSARNSGGGNSARTVQVTETDFKIDASLTTFIPGVTYHFEVSNKGSMAHEFMMMPKSEGSMNGMSMGDMDKMALASIDNIGPGETKTLDYTFPSSAVGSHPEFACYLPGHYEAGMKLDVTVKP